MVVPVVPCLYVVSETRSLVYTASVDHPEIDNNYSTATETNMVNTFFPDLRHGK